MLNNWSGTSIHQFLLLQEPSHHLYSDASGLRCLLSTTLAAVCMAKGEPSPFHCTQGAPPHHTCMSSMGHQWAEIYVLCHCDNVAAVCQVNHLFTRDPIAAHLLHCLVLSMALFDFRIRAVHIAGCMNIGADQLSLDRATAFLDRHPTALPLPTQIPQELTDLLLSPQHSGHHLSGDNCAVISGRGSSCLQLQGAQSRLEPLHSIQWIIQHSPIYTDH